jgi:penicillin-binding protein 1C
MASIYKKLAILIRKKWIKIPFGIIVFLFALWLIVPKPNLLQKVSFSTAIYDRDGELLRLTISDDDKYRLFIPLQEISSDIQSATLLYEDRYFRYHFGVNPAALVGAFWDVYLKGERRKGASTITMQLARMIFDINSKTISGKLEQIFRAFQIELFYNKDEILEAYLNLAPYGHNIEGVGAASLIYFNQRVNAISLLEAIILSVIPQNPSNRTPTRKSGYENMQGARQRLFAEWIKDKPSDKKLQNALSLPINVHTIKELPFYAPHLTDKLIKRYPFKSEIPSTLDLKKQLLLKRQINSYIKRKKSRGIENASALLLNWKTMEVEAFIGSNNFFDNAIEGQVSGVNAKRSPGSALKPFIYALAIDQGIIHPMTLLKDAPKRFGLYTPENFDRGFMGPVFAKDALVYSRNVPAVYLLMKLKSPSFYSFLKDAKISNLKEENFYGLALALGGFEVTMEEMVKLYAMLRNLGKLKSVRFTRFKNDLEEKKETLISPEASFLTLKMLSENPSLDKKLPTILKIKSNYPVYWKTGTSYAFRDAWSVGIFGPYVLAVWIGSFDSQSNPAFVGRKAAAPLFFEIIRSIEKNTDSSDNSFENFILYPGTLNVKEVDMCAPTGDLPGRFCPHTKKAWFIPGKSPIKISDVHRQIPIDKKTGLRACSYDPEKTDLKVFEFWPSDIERLFKQAGMSFRSPPKYNSECTIDATSSKGYAPEIVLPTANMIYSIRTGQIKKERIPFKATVDQDAKEVFWFVNDLFIGKSGKDKPLFWKAKSGIFTVRVVDDLGRVASSRFSVRFVD